MSELKNFLNFSTLEECCIHYDSSTETDQELQCKQIFQNLPQLTNQQMTVFHCNCLSKIYCNTIQKMLSSEKLDQNLVEDAIVKLILDNDIDNLQIILGSLPKNNCREILSVAYAKFKLKKKFTEFNFNQTKQMTIDNDNYNLNLKDVDIFIQCHLLTLNFAAEELQTSKPKINNKSENEAKITIRLNYLINLTERILNSPEKKDSEIDDLFLYDLKELVKNIFMMKNVLPTTTKTIPWLELEFYCIQFIKFYNTDSVENLFSFGVISVEKLISYLQLFIGIIKSEYENRRSKPKQNQKKQKTNVTKENQASQGSRDYQLQQIRFTTPGFTQLIDDYNFLRDLHSMFRINELVKVSNFNLTSTSSKVSTFNLTSNSSKFASSNLTSNTSKIILIRALQVLGEHSKSSIQTPKLSGDLERRLLRILPEDMLEIMRRIRDDVSHSANVRKSLDEEDFCRMQRQLGFIGDAVRHLLGDYCKRFVVKIYNYILIIETDSDFICLRNHLVRNKTSLENILGDSPKGNLFYSHFEKILRNQNYNRVEELKLGFDSFTSDDYLKNFKSLVNLILTASYTHASNVKQKTSLFLKLLNPTPLNLDKFFNYYNIQNKENDRKSGLNKGMENKMADKMAYVSLSDSLEELQELLAGYTCRRFLQEKQLVVATEMVLLEIFSLLDDEKLLTHAHQWIDLSTPILTGKPLRNHLAHYNSLVDILHVDQRIAIFQTAQLLIQHAQKPLRTCYEVHLDLKLIEDENNLLRGYLRNSPVDGEENKIVSLSNSLIDGHSSNVDKLQESTSKKESSAKENVTLSNSPIDGVNVIFKKLQESILEENLNEVRIILENNPKLINFINEFEETPLHLAATSRNIELLKFLLQHGADTKAYDRRGHAPIHRSIISKNQSAFDILLQYEVHPDMNRTKENRTCLHLSAEHDFEITKLLIEKHHCNVTLQALNISLLRVATWGQQEETIVYLLSLSEVANQEEVNCALHVAIMTGSYRVLKILLDFGADPNQTMPDNEASPLHRVTQIKMAPLVQLDFAKLLLSHGANVNSTDEYNKTPLHITCIEPQPKLAFWLIQNGADCTLRDHSGRIPLHYAIENDHFELIQMLLLQNPTTVNFTTQPPLLATPVGLAIMFASPNVVDFLISNGGKFTNLVGTGLDPISMAIKRQDHDNYAICEYLFRQDLRIHIDACVQQLIAQNDIPMMQTLLQCFSDRNRCEFVETEQYPFVVHCACAMMTPNRKELTQVMLDFLQPNYVDCVTNPDQKDTMMHFSALNGDHLAVKKLLAIGGNPNLKNKQFRTPVDIAMAFGHHQVVEVIVKSEKFDSLEKFRSQLDLEKFKYLLDRGHLQFVMVLLRKYVDKEKFSDYLPFFAAQGHLDIVKFLIRSVKSQVDFLEVMQAAIAAGHCHIVDFLLNLEHFDKSDKNLIIFAAGFNQTKIIRHLVRLGFDINEQDGDGNTPLHLAACHNNVKAIEECLRHGAIYNLKNHKRQTFENLTNDREVLGIFQRILEFFEGIHKNDVVKVKGSYISPNCIFLKNGEVKVTPLELAVELGHYEVVLGLLQQGALVTERLRNLEICDERILKILQIIDEMYSNPNLFANSAEIFLNFFENPEEILACLCGTLNTDGVTILQGAILNDIDVHNFLKGLFPYLKDIVLKKHPVKQEIELINSFKVGHTKVILYNAFAVINSLQNNEFYKAKLSLTNLSRDLLIPSGKYCIRLNLKLAKCQMTLGNLTFAIDILNDTFKFANCLDTILKILKLAMIIRRNFNSATQHAHNLCLKIHRVILFCLGFPHFQILQAALLLNVNTKNQNGIDESFKILQEFLNLHPEILTDFETFDDVMGILVMPTSKMKKSPKIFSYYEVSFSLLRLNLQVQVKLKEGNVLKAFQLAKVINSKISQVDFDIKQIINGYNENDLKIVAKSEGFTQGQIERDLKFVLHDAVKHNDLEMVLKCLNYQADYFEHDAFDMKPIDYAVANRNFEILKVFVKQLMVDTIDRLKNTNLVCEEVRFVKDKNDKDLFCYFQVLIRRALENCCNLD